MRIMNRELLKSLISKSQSETISEIAIHVIFMMYGFDNDIINEEENKDEEK